MNTEQTFIVVWVYLGYKWDNTDLLIISHIFPPILLFPAPFFTVILLMVQKSNQPVNR